MSSDPEDLAPFCECNECTSFDSKDGVCKCANRQEKDEEWLKEKPAVVFKERTQDGWMEKKKKPIDWTLIGFSSIMGAECCALGYFANKNHGYRPLSMFGYGLLFGLTSVTAYCGIRWGAEIAANSDRKAVQVLGTFTPGVLTLGVAATIITANHSGLIK
jgi:hypothetical protein